MRRTMRSQCWTPLLLGLLGLGYLALIMISGDAQRQGSPARLMAETTVLGRAALTSAGHGWAQFDIRNGMGVVTGEAPSEAHQAAALAAVQAGIAERIGFPGVISGIAYVPPPPPAEEAPAATPAPQIAAAVEAAQPEAAPPAKPAQAPPAPQTASPPPAAGPSACAQAILAARAGRRINFALGSAELGPEAAKVAADVAAAAKACTGARILIEGHTDLTGAAGANFALSQARADAVRAAMLAAGAPEGALTAQGFGETRPVVTGAGPLADARNRRISFRVTAP